MKKLSQILKRGDTILEAMRKLKHSALSKIPMLPNVNFLLRSVNMNASGLSFRATKIRTLTVGLVVVSLMSHPVFLNTLPLLARSTTTKIIVTNHYITFFKIVHS